MRLHPRRRNVVLWSTSAEIVSRYGSPRPTWAARPGRIRRWVRTSVLLSVIGLRCMARPVRARWRPLLAGAVFTAVGVALRGSPASIVMLPGLMLLLTAPLIPADLKADRLRRLELEHELTAYSTPAQRRDLEATLDRYPDRDTHEHRDILARQTTAALGSLIPGVRRN